MDLVVIPLLLVAGAALTFLGINGLPSMPVPQSSSSRPGADNFVPPERRDPDAGQRLLLVKSWLPRLGQAPATITHAERPASFNDSDVLLNDVLSELIVVRQELAELRTRFESLNGQTEETEPPTKKRGRRSATATSDSLIRAG